MKNSSVELLVHSENIAKTTPELNYEGITVREVIIPESSNYLFIQMDISPEAKPGTFTITFKNGKKTVQEYEYRLQARRPNSAQRESFGPQDIIYLITPDRFANGDTGNDQVASMEEGPDREDPWGRHGGDLKGLMDNIDYIADLGFTAIWLNPVVENNMPRQSYHGYATTDFYKVDPRYGSNEMYAELSRDLRSEGIGLIMDMIVNHCGSSHWWMDDLPYSNWINNDNTYVRTNHQKPAVQDPYASAYDQQGLVDGWFVSSMPDLNQQNEHMATYLIQNAIWWVEYADLYGIRMDTWSYSDKDFLADWSCALQNEYPNLMTTGEEWSANPSIIAYWQEGIRNQDGYSTCLPSLLDFPLQTGMAEGLNDNLNKMYEALANDFIYADPYAFVTFPDNHDMDRIYTQLGEDFSKFKNAMVYTLTVRGIPQIYYGTELLFTNSEKGHHGLIRKDYPGGWPGDEINAFTGAGLTDQQKAARDLIKKLNRWRNGSPAIRNGTIHHFAPFDNIYVFFRQAEDELVMTVINKNQEDKDVDISRLSEILPEGSTGMDILTCNRVSLDDTLLLKAGEPMVVVVD